MKIATFNIQNLYFRDRELTKQYLETNSELWINEFDSLLQKNSLNISDFSRMRDLSDLLGFGKERNSPYLTVVNDKIQLKAKKEAVRPKAKAHALTDWNGWMELGSVPIHPVAIKNKAKAILNVEPDFIVLQGVENRTSLSRFNSELLVKNSMPLYRNVLFMDTNDPYNRGMGILYKKGIRIESITTQICERANNGEPLFDFDLQEYHITTAMGNSFSILSAHLKKGEYDNSSHNQKYVEQLAKIAERCVSIRSEGRPFILLGTFNIASYSKPIIKIQKAGNLHDVAKHDSFTTELDKGNDATYFKMGAYRMGVNISQRDYLMLCPQLFESVKQCGLVRSGMWSRSKPYWKTYPSIKKETHAASEHPLVWADLNC